MNNYINEDIYRSYFNKDENIGESTAPINHQDLIYQNTQSQRAHLFETVSEKDYDLGTFRHLADDNINDIERFAEILKKLCNAAWGDSWGELSPDLKRGEDSSNVILPQITVDINTRDIAEGMGGLKPRLVDVIEEIDEEGNQTGDAFLIYRQWYDTNVEFNIYGRSSQEARKLQQRFENLLNIYTGYLKRHGISEILFEREVSPKSSINYIETIPMRCIYYYIRFESITPIRQSLINRINIEIGANQLNADKVKTLLNNSIKSEAVDLDFFDGDNGITYDFN